MIFVFVLMAKEENFCHCNCGLLSRRPDTRPERPRLSGTGLVKHCPQGFSSSFVTFNFVRAIFSRPFRLSLTPTICPWVSEDAMEPNPKTTELQFIGVQSKLEVRKICMAYCLPLPLPSTVDLSSFFSQVSVFRWKFSPGDLRKIQARLMISKKGSPRYQWWVWGPQFLRVLVFGILLIF